MMKYIPLIGLAFVLLLGCDARPAGDSRADVAAVVAEIEKNAKGTEGPAGAGPEAAARMRSVAAEVERLGLDAWRDRIALSFFFAIRTNDTTPAGMTEYVAHSFVGDRCKPTRVEFLSVDGKVVATAELSSLKRFTIRDGFQSVLMVWYVNWDGRSTERLEGARIVAVPRQEGITVRLVGETCVSNAVPLPLESR